ncbi:MAG TPA: FaeA/PapI family transcriptional regulator [Solirubrobacterales bacterium]|nr:FaeA/PapI family transcriptional regulator [Solirubrobacterales bacterium]
MTEKQSTDERIIEFLSEKGTATVDEICDALKIGRTSVRKYLAGLTVDKKVNREAGGREGRRKLPDVFSLPGKKKAAGKRGESSSAKSKDGRLGPGQLDKLVLDYMRKHKADSPHTASAIGKGIKRSSGAVANCLERQVKAETVRLVKPKPREYALAEGK